MTEGLLELGLSNLLLSAAIGLLAYGVHRRGRYPALAHLLWVLTLVKAVTPPLLTLPLAMPVARGASPVMASAPASAAGTSFDLSSSVSSWLGAYGPAVLVGAWLIGSGLVILITATRIRRFGRLLSETSAAAPQRVQHVAGESAYQLGLRSCPAVFVSTAGLAPMTWWSRGRLRIVLPSQLLTEVDDDQLRWVLAHELAHIKRRDPQVRWLEWGATVVAWWNPAVWWARRHLRRDEEDACDALVLEHLQGGSRSYARTLLTVVEVLSRPALGTPALATGIDAARSLEHRLARIVTLRRRSGPPRLLISLCLAAAALLMVSGFTAVATPAPAAKLSAPPAPNPVTAELEAPGPALPAPLVGSSAPYSQVSASAPIASAGRRSDTHRGTAAADTIIGNDADETVHGLGGADRLGGGPGRDVIHGGDGADTIRGGRGADRLGGGAGPDRLGGGAGADIIKGGAGNDVIQGGAGHDTIYAGAGDDVVRTWADGTPDEVDCGSGDDRAVIGSTDTTTRCEVVIVREVG